MTPVDALVAEAIQLARESTPPLVNECARVTYRGTDSAWAWYTRDDVRDAALAHLATRAAEAEGRAERAEAALIRVVEVGDGVGFDVAVKALREAGLMDPEDDDEEDTAHE